MADKFNRIVLVNPRWDFEGSRYWACREPHLPLELLYSEALLRAGGMAAWVVDAHLEDLTPAALAERVGSLEPEMIALTTAPTYLFWRCPPPELEVPRAACEVLTGIALVVALGPHGSATPGYALEQLGCQAVIRGEPEEELVRLAGGEATAATVWAGSTPSVGAGATARTDVALLPALDYRGYPLERRAHRHHVFWDLDVPGGTSKGRGAEVEFSRGCPYGCSFCNRRFFRSRYRERPVERVLAELRRLRDLGVDYVYFIDEVFGLGRCNALLEALVREPIVRFGCQTRIDLWDEARFDRLADAGCISLELGLESPFPDVQAALNKGYRLGGDRILDLMVYAKGRIPWVHGDLIRPLGAGPEMLHRLEDWRQEAIARGVWVSEPVDLFLYPGCDLHDQVLGPVDEGAWERARRHRCVS